MTRNDDLIAPEIPQDPHDAHKCTDECWRSCDGCAAVFCKEFDRYVQINNVGTYCDSCLSDYQL